MPIKIEVPASEIANLKSKELVLDKPARCSRCNNPDANFYESHRLLYKIGHAKPRLTGKKYRVAKAYTLKIRVCENCYLADYLSHPENLDRDDTRQGKIARFHTLMMTVGGLFAAVGFLLLTPFVPNTPVMQSLKELWKLPVATGVLVLLLTWLSQRKQQSKVTQQLESANYEFLKYSRAETYAPILASETDLEAAALVIKLDNVDWAMQAAEEHRWTLHELTSDDRLHFAGY